MTTKEHSPEAVEFAKEYMNRLPTELICTDVAQILSPTLRDTGVIVIVNNFSLILRTDEGKTFYQGEGFVFTGDFVENEVGRGIRTPSAEASASFSCLARIHTYIHTHIHTYVRTYIHTYIHT